MKSTVPETMIAIDAPTTRDVDDAIGLVPEGDGWRATLAIADAAAHVPIGSTEDTMAMRQGATVYLRDRAVQTMLPRRLAEDLATLRAGQPRRVLELTLAISPTFDVALIDLQRAERAITAHVPYGSIAERARSADDPLQPMLRDLVGVSQGLLQGRRARGALAFYDLSRLLFLDEEGRPQEATSSEDAVGQILVQEFMILANAALSRWALEHNVPVLYRNHVANLAAPAADVVARNVQAWMNGGEAAESAAREQLALILGVAQYGPKLQGHYALNLPSYLHGTSPLRRYADLIVQRQINAALDGQSLPYDVAGLATISEELNATLLARKMERKEGFKQTVVRRAERALDRGQFERLADHELSQVLKVADAERQYPDGLIAVVAERMRDGTLADPLFDRLLATAPGTLPALITEAWQTFLVATPQRAKHLVVHGHQTGLFGGYTTSTQGPDLGPFTVTATMTRVATSETLTARCTAARKRDAENGAAARLVLRHLGVVVDDGPAVAPIGAAITREDPGNAKGRLQERCQKARWPMPRYVGTSTGPIHSAVFACEVTVDAGAASIVGRSTGARTRLEAEHRAAADALTKLPKSAPGAPSKGAPAQAPNPIGWLQERCQERGAPLPTYAFESKAGGGFVCTLVSEVLTSSPVRGEGQNQSEAKRAAAAAGVAAYSEVQA